MKNLVLLVITFSIVTSCGTFEKPRPKRIFKPIKKVVPVVKVKYVPMSTRIDTCIKQYIKLDLLPKTSQEICNDIHRRR